MIAFIREFVTGWRNYFAQRHRLKQAFKIIRKTSPSAKMRMPAPKRQ
jgi:hypothetical protein